MYLRQTLFMVQKDLVQKVSTKEFFTLNHMKGWLIKLKYLEEVLNLVYSYLMAAVTWKVYLLI